MVLLGTSDPDASRKFNFQKNFVNTLLEKFDISRDGTLTGVVSYGLPPSIEWRLGSRVDKVSTKESINKLRNSGYSTDIDKAFALVNDTILKTSQGARPNTPKSVLMFVDKKSIGDQKKITDMAKYFKDEKIRLVIVGLGNAIDKEMLKPLAFDENSYFFPPSLEEIQPLVKPVVAAILPGMYICTASIFISKNFVYILQTTVKKILKMTQVLFKVTVFLVDYS